MTPSVSYEAFPSVDHIPASVDKVVVNGIQRTDEALLKKQFRTLVKSTDLNGLLANVQEAQTRLIKLDVFRSVFAVVDVADEADKYTITFNVREKRPTHARLNLTQGTDGTTKMCGSFRLNNLLGGAEFADLDLEFGRNQSISRFATLSKPLENNPYVRFSLGGTDGQWDHWWAKFLRHEKSMFAEVAADTNFGVHKFQWDAIWREIESKDQTTPWSVRLESGSAVKLDLRHTFENDSRSDLVFPDSGLLCRFSQEIASISPGSLKGSDDRCKCDESDRSLQLKLDNLILKPFRLANWLVAELSLATGLTHSFTKHPIHIADRYFLGGPLELRGFQWRSVSPVEPLVQPFPPNSVAADNDSSSIPTSSPDAPMSPIGTEGYWLTGAHVYTPLPFFGQEKESYASAFRLHGFCMTGSTMSSPFERINNCLSGSSIGSNLISELTGQMRTVVGCGLVVRFAGLLRIEINYCVPLQKQPGDSAKQGFMFGFGMYYW